jgi:hypothetical protein
MSAVNPLVRTTVQDAPTRGDENHVPLVENPFAGTPNAPEYENGYQYAQTLGHQTLNQLSPDQVASWKTAPVAWRTGFADAAEKLGVKTIADQLRGGPMKAANWSWTKLAESDDEDEKDEKEDEDDDEDDKKKKAVPWNFSKGAAVYRLPTEALARPRKQIDEEIQKAIQPINIQLSTQNAKPAKPVTANIVKSGEWNWQKSAGIFDALKPLAGAGIGAMIPPLLGAGLGAGVGELAHMSMDPLYANSMGDPSAPGPGPTAEQVSHENRQTSYMQQLSDALKAHHLQSPAGQPPPMLQSHTPSTADVFFHHQPDERLNWEVPVGALGGLGAGMAFAPHGALIGGGLGALSSLSAPRRRDPNLMPL